MSYDRKRTMISPIMSTYKRLPVAFDHGKGVRIYDTDGNEYLDALCGLAVTGLGHAHPAVTQAVSDQVSKLNHTSNLYQIPNQQELAARLVAVSGMESCFFGNSGAEANEAAIKLARLYGHNKGIDLPTIIVTEGSFHGRTMATLSATGNRAIHQGFEPLLKGFARAPFNDVEAIREIGKNNSDVVAVLVEPVIGEGGIAIPDANYLAELRELCDQNGWLLMLDEIQTGNGRTGKYFAYQHTNILADVVTTAKGLANGLPIGVCMARGEAATTLTAGKHGSTYGGNPLVCAAALAVMDTIEQDGLVQRAAELGERMLQGLKDELGGANYIKEIRGFGLMIGIELTEPCAELVSLALLKGLLINVTAGSVVRLLPPLVLTDDEADEIVSRVSQLIKVYAGDDRSRPRA
ncbi:MAG: aspartate aminotransferase family protein [Pseudomonadales bacterium]|nr:aspartate aminotransferase family protein [Pseudomonadales bacterium]